MKKLLATVLFSVLFLSSIAQKAPIKFGDISMEDMKMKSYALDTSAAAVILTDYGQAEFSYQDKGWQLLFERVVRIKILNKSGYRWADFAIPLYHTNSDREKISGFKAVTYNLENGKIVETKLKNDATFVEKATDNVDLTKFTFPNVKEGSIIEVSYKILSDFIYNFQDWEFQSLIPVKWSEYRATFPEFFHYEKFMQGYITLNTNEKKEKDEQFTVTYENLDALSVGSVGSNQRSYTLPSRSTVHRWVAQDVPAFKEEPFLTSYRDYISKINFELGHVKYPDQPIKPVMGTWEDLNRNFLENNYFGDPIRSSGFLKNIAEQVTAGLATPQEKIAAIYHYVKSNVAWDGRYRKYIDSSLKKVLDEKKGSSAEINLLLVSMIQKADIVANPVLISTRNNGFIRENLAISSQFNYVICQATVDGKSILLDATEGMLPMNTLPERCINGRGYVISKETPGWITIPASKSKIYASAEIELNAEGMLKGKMSISHDGYFGHSMRNEYLKKGEEEYTRDFSHRMSWEINKSEFENIKNLNEAAKEKYEFTHSENFGNAAVLYVNPLLYERLDENPFKLEKRVYPVDFGKTTDHTFICKLTIPENYQAEEIPGPKVFSLPNNAAKYIYNIQVVGNQISLTSILSINRSLFSQEEYPNLREFYNLVVAKQAEQIVLKKKN